MKRTLKVLMLALIVMAVMAVTMSMALADPKGGNFKPGPDNPDLNFKSPNSGGFR
jgi:hypothetical protein